MGTPAYMPPEQASGEIELLNERSDVFSLGAILCEILTGQPPYTGVGTEVIEKALRCRLDDARERLSGCGADEDLVSLAGDCLSPSPMGRPANAGEVADRVGQYLAAAEQRVQEAQFKARTAKRTQRLAMAVGLIIAAALVVAVVSWQKVDEALGRYNLLAAVVDLRDARAEEKKLYPPWPEKAGEMRAWLDEARALVASIPQLRDTLVDVQSRAVSREPEFVFDDRSQEYLHDQLEPLIGQLEEFARSEVSAVEKRLTWAESVKSATIDEFAGEWQSVIQELAHSELYGDLEMTPQVGLVPLGKDPDSGLFEFVHLYSGRPGKEMPFRGVTADTGIVFVLIPGGKFMMGAEKSDEVGPNLDPLAAGDEGPPHEVELAAFFLSKCEMTVGQWERLTGGATPSQIYDRAKSLAERGAMPVQNVSWDQCDELLRQHGLELPTEAQWEYACRAGSTTPWHFGRDPAQAGAYANVLDLAASDLGFDPGTGEATKTRDGYAYLAPVGKLKSNDFGLHDMHGNVWEWCRDAKGVYLEAQARPGDGLRVAEGTERVDRGGSFAFSADRARSSYRFTDVRGMQDGNLGLRAARAIR